MHNQAMLSPQCAAILSALRSGAHTTLQLNRTCGVMAVSSRIRELRVIGYVIETTLIKVPTRYGDRAHVARYTLTRRRPKAPARATRRRA